MFNLIKEQDKKLEVKKNKLMLETFIQQLVIAITCFQRKRKYVIDSCVSDLIVFTKQGIQTQVRKERIPS